MIKRNNPLTSQIAGKGKGHGFAVSNPGLSTVGSFGDAVAAGTTSGVDVGQYQFITLYIENAAAGGTVAPEVSPGFVDETSSELEPYVPLANTAALAGAVSATPLVYTYADDVSFTIPVGGAKSVRFVLTGGAANIRYTLHS